MTRVPRLVTAVVGTAVLLAVLLLGVFPTRSFFAQRDEIERERMKLAVLDRENARLAERVGQLQSDAEIERLAREQYSLVRPGEEAYAILPSGDAASTGDETPPPASDPDDDLQSDADRSLVEQVVDTVTFWN